MKLLICTSVALVSLSSLLMAAPARKHAAVDPDDAYKNHCMRCHTALPQYSPRMNKTILLHMKQAANIPGDEAEAILRYLNGDSQDAAPSNKTAAITHAR